MRLSFAARKSTCSANLSLYGNAPRIELEKQKATNFVQTQTRSHPTGVDRTADLPPRAMQLSPMPTPRFP